MILPNRQRNDSTKKWVGLSMAMKTKALVWFQVFSEDLNYETYEDNYFNLLHELQDLLKKKVDLVAEKTLKNPYLIESINESKIQLI